MSDIDRRDASKVMLAASAATMAGGEQGAEGKPQGGRMPTIFVAHGAPPLLEDGPWRSELERWASALPRPASILMLSAHWEARPISIGATHTVPLIYDFYGFPERFYRLAYPSPGAPALAARVRDLLRPLGAVADEPERGLDHGAWVPLQILFPGADIPVLQLSLPSMDAKEIYAVGRRLAPLRKEGVLIVGSGHLTHNLRRADFRPDAPTPAWASDFDAWVADALRRSDVDALLDYRARAPGVRESLPTHEHFVPVLANVGAAFDASAAVTFPITGWFAGSLTKRSAEWG